MIGKIILRALLFLFLGIAFYVIYNNIYLPNDPSTYKYAEIISNTGEIISDTGQQFYPDMRFNHLPITYSIDSTSCSTKRQEDARAALEILSEKTVLTFSERALDGDVNVKCSDENNETAAGLFVAGEGGPTLVRPTGMFNVIEKGSVLLIRDSDCDTPNVAIHELLHVFGFDHSNNQSSIMYNITDCNQEIPESIIDKINSLYSLNPLPDLYIFSVNATKKTIYLDFEVEVRNKGLVESESSNLTVESEGEVLQKFELGNIDFGAGKILQVKNVRIPRDVGSFEFIVDIENKITELNEDNNNLVVEIK
jgi:hypothetical protein